MIRSAMSTVRHLKHTYYGSNWTNEAMAGYQYYQWNTNPLNFQDRRSAVQRHWSIRRGITSFQNLTQKRFSLRDDFTYTGWNWAGSHVLKFGVNDDIDKYDFNKESERQSACSSFDAATTFTNPDAGATSVSATASLSQNNNSVRRVRAG